ncbi:hypothetical protein L2E82_10896 [Cichorium intybus]|uniref:Uncharacterized protein n=1 Tax=Cichorium intybus TaxID=13427 RepID=A0ACB9GCV9_CICIN|nr:hypothetical protein L2E82_10896 [Cichorium intybus]
MAEGGGRLAAERLSQNQIDVMASQNERCVSPSQKESGVFTFEDYKVRITCSIWNASKPVIWGDAWTMPEIFGGKDDGG